MTINSSFYSNSASKLSSGLFESIYANVPSLNSVRKTSYRGGVTGWENKETNLQYRWPKSTETGSSDAKSFVFSVARQGTAMNSAISALSGKKQTSAFDMLMGTSSDEKSISAGVSNQKKASVFNDINGGKKNVEVFQLAASQKNSGTALSSRAVNELGAGRNTFAIEKDGKAFQFNVNVNATDSNRTVQEKMADAINKQKMGVTASVVYDDEKKTSGLMLEADGSGEKNAFVIKDTDGGNIVSETGAGNVTNNAADALYSVDGVEKASSRNEVDLGNGISAAFKATTDAAVTIGVETDGAGVEEAIYDLVDSFNELRETAEDAGGGKNSKALVDRLDSLAGAYKYTLNRVGITADDDGYLEIDDKKLQSAIGSGQAENALGGSSGFTRSLSAVADQAESNPERFLSYETRADFNEYFGGGNSFSYLHTPRFSQWSNFSSLLNAWV